MKKIYLDEIEMSPETLKSIKQFLLDTSLPRVIESKKREKQEA